MFVSELLWVQVSGPLSVFAAGFGEELLERGYRPGTVAKQLQLMAHLSRWMAADNIAPAALGRVEIERFGQERRASHVQLASAHALEALPHPRKEVLEVLADPALFAPPVLSSGLVGQVAMAVDEICREWTWL
jgi:hypothetical protein